MLCFIFLRTIFIFNKGICFRENKEKYYFNLLLLIFINQITKTMKKTLLILLAILTFSLNSCKKDEPEPSKTELLTNKSWTVIKNEDYENGQLIDTEYPDGVVLLDFKTDHTGKTTDDGGIYTWTWAFVDSESKLFINDGEADTLTIETLSGSKLTLSSSNGNYKSIFYFEH